MEQRALFPLAPARNAWNGRDDNNSQGTKKPCILYMDTWVYFSVPEHVNLRSRLEHSEIIMKIIFWLTDWLTDCLTDFAVIVPSDYAPWNLFDETGFTRNKAKLSYFLIIYICKCNKLGGEFWRGGNSEKSWWRSMEDRLQRILRWPDSHPFKA